MISYIPRKPDSWQILFKGAADAINYDSCNEEVLPFIKNLFIKKPQVDLNLTLGPLQIKKKQRTGQVLPMCKKDIL
jgi:hypothetical protein